METDRADVLDEAIQLVHEFGSAVDFLCVVAVDEARLHFKDSKRLGTGRGSRKK